MIASYGFPDRCICSSGKSCPTSDGDWYWSNNKSCCLPKTKPSAPTPTCSSGWSWDHSNSCCSGGGSSTTTSSNPGPSQKSHNKKRGHASRGSTLCPTGLDACPIKGALGLSSDYECIDTTQELESCGGCASTGAGQDCTAIEGAWNVACNAGACAGAFIPSSYTLAVTDPIFKHSLQLHEWLQARRRQILLRRFVIVRLCSVTFLGFVRPPRTQHSFSSLVKPSFPVTYLR